MNSSPLRYPGGKSKLTPFLRLLIEKSDIDNPIYIEPFAGGAGVALSLLFNGDVEEIVINDYDKAVYSMWRAILEQTDEFIELINNTEINVEEWNRQKDIYLHQGKKYSIELGFAAFYLNRTNRSGIISKAGPIGGINQTGAYKIDARFNKEDLISRIKKIQKYKRKIHLYNKDAESFIKNYIPKYEDRAFVYFDPPYYNKGKELYKNFYSDKDHRALFRSIINLKCPWVVTYDDVKEIREIYSQFSAKLYDLVYSLANKGKKSEIMFFSNKDLCPTTEILQKKDIIINLREVVD